MRTRRWEQELNPMKKKSKPKHELEEVRNERVDRSWNRGKNGRVSERELGGTKSGYKRAED